MSDVANLILDVIQAARDVVKCADSVEGVTFLLKILEDRLEDLDTVLQPENQDRWVPGTWADVRPQHRVRLKGQEAEVVSALPLTWAGSGTREIAVRLKGRDGVYHMPPSGPIEILRSETPACTIELDDLYAVASALEAEASH